MIHRICACALALVILLGAASARAEEDPWLGPDKFLHFGVSAGAAMAGYATSAFFLEEPWQRATAGASLALSLGAGKELYDLAGAGDASWRDFTWDAVGTAVGVGLALAVDVLVLTRDDRDTRTTTAAFSF